MLSMENAINAPKIWNNNYKFKSICIFSIYSKVPAFIAFLTYLGIITANNVRK